MFKQLSNYLLLVLTLAGDVELNPGPNQREVFTEKQNLIKKDATSQIFSREDIANKVSLKLADIPLAKKEAEKWMRVQKTYNASAPPYAWEIPLNLFIGFI